MASGLFTLKNQLVALIQNAWSGTSPSNAPKYLEYLVVAGGGGGGSYGNAGNAGGGGGAGGLLQGLLPIVLGQSYTVTIGAAGTAVSAGTNATGGNGLNSVLGNITAIGGGGGGTSYNNTNQYGQNGGSGGGSGSYNVNYPYNIGGQGTSGQGNAGGNGSYTANAYGGGGGGGAGTIGTSGTTSATPTANYAGNGGAGITSSISGTITAYAGGGGGGSYTSGGNTGIGGVGGGGAGNYNATATSGSVNSGGGGGGTGYGNSQSSGAGGSGIVIVRYRGNVRFFSGGTLSYDSVNNYTVHTFYATGTLAPLATPTTYGTTSSLTKSLRFRSSNSAYLSRTPATTTNRTTWTWSGWVKRGSIGGSQVLFGAGPDGSNYTIFYFSGTVVESLEIYNYTAGSTTGYVYTSSIFKDPSAWYHIVLAVDTTQATSADRIKIYVNNVLQPMTISTAFASSLNTFVNANNSHRLGCTPTTSTFYDGYMAEVNLIDGQALTPQAFGQYDSTTGVWQPMTFVGTYGTNGFYLPFTNTTSTTTLGYDSSGNSNNFATSGISLTAGSTYDSMNDVPTLTSATASNYAVLNPNYKSATLTATASNGNLFFTRTASYGPMPTSITMSSGKWYWESIVQSNTTGVTYAPAFGLSPISNIETAVTVYNGDGTKNINGGSNLSYASSFTTGDVIGMAFDADAGTLTAYKNNTSQGTLATGLTSGPYVPIIYVGTGTGGTVTASINFGQQPFTYTPPSGFVALNTYNLPTPAIVRGNQYMDATTYNGVGGSQTIMNAGQFQPDFVWYKARSYAYNHGLYDSVRGATKFLISNTTDAETTLSGVTSFNSNGFTVGSDAGDNSNGNTFVAWQWRASNATAVSNTSGSITSSVSANTTSGFSIVTYTGTGANATVGHGLGVAPSMMIVKSRTNVLEWDVYHVSLGPTKRLFLDSTSAVDTSINPWNNTAPTSTVFSIGVGLNVNTSGASLVAYCFAPIVGFSAFGSYTGNGSTSGPFVYLGFRPKFVLVKCYDGANNWNIYDSSRNTYNPENYKLIPNASDAEYTISGGTMNFLSNGFQLINTSADFNGNGYNYIYMAFAENPFKYANAR